MKNYNFNKVSRCLVTFIALVIVSYNIIDYIIVANKKENTYNYVELKTRFKRYLVVDKYMSNSKYMFRLVNPVTDKEYKVHVTDNLYYNMYFVGDTIK